ncbi:SMI1/KNR4 family protein [Bacillus sp. DX4.1]|uniref:SMI1/KNR4 family protein n=1 Tax=Bacillus sp. DX4.1 TaxID=3055867 RepID=UPI0025A13DA3|nr:SMI1/KNR4 family protein [Bacillus sp. DX4.1]MDM5186113.1 SMI1/KNR4 family protein [Bacillus sp. DX4.1]
MQEQITEIINTYQKEDDFLGGINDDFIQNAEKLLKVKFPKSYRWFLNTYGSGGLAGMEIYGCEDTFEDSSVVYHTNMYREQYNLSLNYVVLNDIDGTVTCLDVNQMNNKECPVILWSRFTKELYKITYNNFYSYLLDCLQESVDNFYEED